MQHNTTAKKEQKKPRDPEAPSPLRAEHGTSLVLELQELLFVLRQSNSPAIGNHVLQRLVPIIHTVACRVV